MTKPQMKAIIGLATAALGITLAPRDAAAGFSPYRQTVQRAARTGELRVQGAGSRSSAPQRLELLRVAASEPATSLHGEVLGQLESMSSAQVEFDGGTLAARRSGVESILNTTEKLRAQGDGWSWTVDMDATGSRFRYFNEHHVTEASRVAELQPGGLVSRPAPPSKTDVVGIADAQGSSALGLGFRTRRVPVALDQSDDHFYRKAEAFVRARLAKLVRLGAGEQLVPWMTKKLLAVSGTADPADRTEKLAAVEVVLGRSIDGVPVVGPGSKVAIIFGADGQVAEFSGDWPALEGTGEFQDVVDARDVERRVREWTPSAPSATTIELSSFECGYVDLGYGLRDPHAVLQAGCEVLYVAKYVTAEGTMSYGTGDIIPIGEAVEYDAAWPLAYRASQAESERAASDLASDGVSHPFSKPLPKPGENDRLLAAIGLALPIAATAVAPASSEPQESTSLAGCQIMAPTGATVLTSVWALAVVGGSFVARRSRR